MHGVFKVPTKKAETWCHQKGDMKYYETSAKDNTSFFFVVQECMFFFFLSSLDVEQAFLEIARIGLSREVADEAFACFVFVFLDLFYFFFLIQIVCFYFIFFFFFFFDFKSTVLYLL
jgi:hypothetical protein